MIDKICLVDCPLPTFLVIEQMRYLWFWYYITYSKITSNITSWHKHMILYNHHIMVVNWGKAKQIHQNYSKLLNLFHYHYYAMF